MFNVLPVSVVVCDLVLSDLGGSQLGGAASGPQLAHPGRVGQDRRRPTGRHGVARADDWRRLGRSCQGLSGPNVWRTPKWMSRSRSFINSRSLMPPSFLPLMPLS